MRWRCSTLCALLLFLLLGWLGQSTGYRICAFKLKNLNAVKAANKRVMYTLKRVVSRCDICLLQDVKDPKGLIMKQMVTNLNRDGASYDNHTYQMIASENLGSNPNDMQQYVFIYRNKTTSVADNYQSKSKSFVRPPFAVQFKSKKTRVGKFVLVAVHTEPRNAVKEMDHLYDVYQDVSRKWNTKMVMFLGNFNAGCGHMTRPKKKEIRLFTKPGFYWLISDNVDTTTTDTTECAYDRIVVQGKEFLKQIEPYTAMAFNFHKKFHLPLDEAIAMSDNYPIEVTLKSSTDLTRATPLLILLSLSAILSACLSAL